MMLNEITHMGNHKIDLKEIGKYLRAKRLEKNISTKDISKSLMIGEEQLIALEEGEKNLLPEDVYIKAMVRRVSEKLSIEIEEIMKGISISNIETTNTTNKVTEGSKKYKYKKIALFTITFILATTLFSLMNNKQAEIQKGEQTSMKIMG